MIWCSYFFPNQFAICAMRTGAPPIPKLGKTCSNVRCLTATSDNVVRISVVSVEFLLCVQYGPITTHRQQQKNEQLLGIRHRDRQPANSECDQCQLQSESDVFQLAMVG